MIKMKHTFVTFVLFLVIGIAGQQACAKAPPNLSPQGQQNFQTLQIVRDLDLLRDIAIEANKTEPPIMTTATTRRVVEYHRSSLVVLRERPAGWQKIVSQGLVELQTHLSPKDKEVLGPYISLINVILQGVL